MEKFFELFGHNIKTERLEMRILEPKEENALLVWNVLKNENPDDFIYSSRLESILPTSQEDTLHVMQYYHSIKDNIRSYNSIIKSGYHLDGINRQYMLTPDGIYHDECFFTKLVSEYIEQKSRFTNSNG